jgi:hypothetical protein
MFTTKWPLSCSTRNQSHFTNLFNMTINSARQHNYFITQGTYIGYMFRLKISHLQAYFCHLSHKMLCTLWDSIVFTTIEYVKLNASQPRLVLTSYLSSNFLTKNFVDSCHPFHIPCQCPVPEFHHISIFDENAVMILPITHMFIH